MSVWSLGEKSGLEEFDKHERVGGTSVMGIVRTPWRVSDVSSKGQGQITEEQQYLREEQRSSQKDQLDK